LGQDVFRYFGDIEINDSAGCLTRCLVAVTRV